MRRCFPELPAWVDLQVDDLLDRAGAYQDDDDFQGVLACAEEAARQAARSVEAHHNRALALMRLGRFEEARDALALALAIAPDDGECLELAAELYINRLPPSAERTGIGLEYAQRGRRTTAGRNRLRGARLALLEGQALVDLGRAAQALDPLAAARSLNPSDVSARYEQGVAYFELCRFVAARRAFEDVLARDATHAHALYHLALIRERDGRDLEADRLFKDASGRDPKSFPPCPRSPRRSSSGGFARPPSACRPTSSAIWRESPSRPPRSRRPRTSPPSARRCRPPSWACSAACPWAGSRPSAMPPPSRFAAPGGGRPA